MRDLLIRGGAVLQDLAASCVSSAEALVLQASARGSSGDNGGVSVLARAILY